MVMSVEVWTDNEDWGDWLDQDAQDEKLRASMFTGAMYDNTTKDFAAWYEGRIIGFAPSTYHANEIIKNQDRRNKNDEAY